MPALLKVHSPAIAFAGVTAPLVVPGKPAVHSIAEFAMQPYGGVLDKKWKGENARIGNFVE